MKKDVNPSTCAVVMAYVKGSSSDNWHWCKNCTQYPMYIEKRCFDRPKSQLCPQCKEREDNRICAN